MSPGTVDKTAATCVTSFRPQRRVRALRVRAVERLLGEVDRSVQPSEDVIGDDDLPWCGTSL